MAKVVTTSYNTEVTITIPAVDSTTCTLVDMVVSNKRYKTELNVVNGNLVIRAIINDARPLSHTTIIPD
jgi:hypothetical protein